MNNDLTEIAAESAAEETEHLLQERLDQFNGLKSELSEVKEHLDIAPENKNYLIQAYHLIMNLRAFFTGETIEYIIYTFDKTNENAKPKVYRVNDEHLGLKKSQSDLKLGQIAENIRQADRKAQIIVNKHWDKIMASMEKVKVSDRNLYQVIETILKKYGQENPGLYYDQEKRKMWFNKGQIAEAFFKTGKDVYRKTNKELDYETTFDRYYFGKYLKKDSTKGFQGGDYRNLQIKATNASIMAGSAIKSYIEALLQLLNLQKTSKEDIKSKLKVMFTSKDSPQSLNKHIDKVVNEITKNLNKI